MWVKKLPNELKKNQIKSDLKAAKWTAVIIIGTLIFSSIFRSGGENYRGESFLVFPEDIIGRFQSSALPIIVCGFAIYAFYWVSVRIIPLPMDSKSICVCQRCGTEKKYDGKFHCTCGGHFEDINKMHWIEQDEIT